MKDSFKSNLIIILLIIILALLLTNIRMNKQLVRDYVKFMENKSPENPNSQNKNLPTAFKIQITYGGEDVSLTYDKEEKIAEYRDDHTGKILDQEEAFDLFHNKIRQIDFKGAQSQLVDLLLYELDLPKDFTKIDLKLKYGDEALEYQIENK